MSLIIDVPNGQGSQNAWAGTYVDVQVNDGDVTNVNTLAGNAMETFVFPNLPPNIVDPVNSAIFKAVARFAGTAATMSISTGAGWTSVGALTGGYANYQVNAASLVKATLQGYESGVRWDTGDNLIICTYFTREVDVTFVSGGFMLFLSWLSPILGAGLDLAIFHRAVHLLHRIVPGWPRFSESEVLEIWKAWQAWKHASYIFLQKAPPKGRGFRRRAAAFYFPQKRSTAALI